MNEPKLELVSCSGRLLLWNSAASPCRLTKEDRCLVFNPCASAATYRILKDGLMAWNRLHDCGQACLCVCNEDLEVFVLVDSEKAVLRHWRTYREDDPLLMTILETAGGEPFCRFRAAPRGRDRWSWKEYQFEWKPEWVVVGGQP